MNFDYSKVVSFLLGKTNNILNDVLKTIISHGFVMMDVNVPNKMILLEKNQKKFILMRKDNSIIIFPNNYKSVCFTEDFGEVTEIRINDDGDIVLSKLFNINNPEGVIATTSTWKYLDNVYSQVAGKVLFVEKEKIDVIENQDSVEMFINTYYSRRSGFLSDLYYDFESFTKDNFIDLKLSERIMINDGYTFEKFENLYQKFDDKILNVVKEKAKPSLF